MYEKLDEVRGVSKGLAKWETFNKAVESRAALRKGSVRWAQDVYLALPDNTSGPRRYCRGGKLFGRATFELDDRAMSHR